MDEQAVFRHGVVACLDSEAGLEIDAAADRASLRGAPDVAIVSPEAARRQRFRCPIIVCSADGEGAQAAPGNRVAGVLPRGTLTNDQLRTTVRAVAAGLVVSGVNGTDRTARSGRLLDEADAVEGGPARPEPALARVWVDDPHPIFRRGLVNCLQAAGFAIAGESSAFRPEPDLSECEALLFDVDAVGLQTPASLAQRHEVRLIGLVREGGEEQLYDSVTAGLAGVLVRRELTPARLSACVRAVIEGSGALPPDLLDQLLSALARGAPRGATSRTLVRRELAVLKLLAEGHSTRDIADRLSYSERTVKNVIHDLLVKLNCRTRAHAVALAMRHGMI